MSKAPALAFSVAVPGSPFAAGATRRVSFCLSGSERTAPDGDRLKQ
ncbi:hypothetical protein [Parabacteroides sp.]